MRIGVILASHGEFAKAALGAVEMIAGKQADVATLSLTAEKSLETFEDEMKDAYAQLISECDQVVACAISTVEPRSTSSLAAWPAVWT